MPPRTVPVTSRPDRPALASGVSDTVSPAPAVNGPRMSKWFKGAVSLRLPKVVAPPEAPVMVPASPVRPMLTPPVPVSVMEPCAYRPSVPATVLSGSGVLMEMLPALGLPAPADCPSCSVAFPPGLLSRLNPDSAAGVRDMIWPGTSACTASIAIARPGVTGEIATSPPGAVTDPKLRRLSVTISMVGNAIAVAGAPGVRTGPGVRLNTPPARLPNCRLPPAATVRRGVCSAIVRCPPATTWLCTAKGVLEVTRKSPPA